ncbi:MAG TPA: serine hydrolase domain-containing protein [Salinimicrobium sp.]|nr:serine hydrolase domain-containing protein [Salinimicrobium sp.]
MDPIENIDPAITIEQLLRHESGLGEIVGNQKWDAYNIPHDKLLRKNVFENVPEQDYSEIGKFNYTNTNYILLGEILEKINDEYYFRLLEERIFIPCGMKESYPMFQRISQI